MSLHCFSRALRDVFEDGAFISRFCGERSWHSGAGCVVTMLSGGREPLGGTGTITIVNGAGFIR